MRHNTRLLLIIGFSILTLTACGGGGSSSDKNKDDRNSTPEQDTTTDAEFNSEIINSSSYDNYVYYNLSSGSIVDLTAEQAASSTDWHLGFRRNAVILNGGVSGPGKVTGALAADQADFYSDGEADVNVFLNANAENEVEQLHSEYDVASLDFVEDGKQSAIQATEDTIGTAIDMGWYWYDFTSHEITLNDSNYWMLRSENGDSFARFHATSLAYDNATGLDVTFEFDVQTANTDQFTGTAMFLAHVDASGGSTCFDFDNNSEINCSENKWDLKLEVDGRNWYLWTNSGISSNGSGAAFGPLDSDSATEYTSAIYSPSGNNISSHYLEDSSAGVFADSPWFEYNLQENHQLWPNYRVYLIDTDSENESSEKYQIQITNFYSDSGDGGFPNIRYIAVTPN